MCLEALGTFKPCKVGYQVKRKDILGYRGIFNVSPYMEMGWTAKADRMPISCTCTEEHYTSGFHVFHDLDDARYYRNNNVVLGIIVMVKTGGKKTSGYQSIGPNRPSARVTVCGKITLLKEVKVRRKSLSP